MKFLQIFAIILPYLSDFIVSLVAALTADNQ